MMLWRRPHESAKAFFAFSADEKEATAMPMQMGFRWYGEGNDKISLSDIR